MICSPTFNKHPTLEASSIGEKGLFGLACYGAAYVMDKACILLNAVGYKRRPLAKRPNDSRNGLAQFSEESHDIGAHLRRRIAAADTICVSVPRRPSKKDKEDRGASTAVTSAAFTGRVARSKNIFIRCSFRGNNRGERPTSPVAPREDSLSPLKNQLRHQHECRTLT